MWNSVEVHAIYALFYTMCTSEEGLNLLSQYFSSNDKRIYEPIFIAQYLLAPVNTIVQDTLHPWMMKPYREQDHSSDKY